MKGKKHNYEEEEEEVEVEDGPEEIEDDPEYVGAPAGEGNHSSNAGKEEMDNMINELKGQLQWNPTVDTIWHTVYNKKYPMMKQVLEQKQLTIDGKTLRFNVKYYGAKPADGYKLVIGMHGGGGVEKEVNDEQYDNHKELYDFPEDAGILWLTARSCEDVPDMWHRAYVDKMWCFLIQAFFLDGQININKVFLTGFSAGGDGTYQLAPRLAPRLAGACMCAGCPNNVSLRSVRNITFTIDLGGEDHAYDRNKLAQEYGEMLDQWESEDPEGYDHKWAVHEGREHWMDCAELPNLLYTFEKERFSYPKKLVWHQNSGIMISSFNWLALDNNNMKADTEIIATYDGNDFEIETEDVHRVGVRISTRMCNIQHPISIKWNGSPVFHGMVQPNFDVIFQSLDAYCDPYEIYVAVVWVNKP